MQLYVATRKGLFIIDAGRWAIGKPHFLGDPVTAVLPQGESIYAALNLGHFGVKLRRSDDRGETWNEVAAPAYPAKPIAQSADPISLGRSDRPDDTSAGIRRPRVGAGGPGPSGPRWASAQAIRGTWIR